MKKTITTLLCLLLIVGTTRAEDIIAMDTILWNLDGKVDSKQIQERMKKAEEAMRKAEEAMKKAQERLGKHGQSLGDSIPWSEGWSAQLRSLPKGWLGEYGHIDLPKDQKPLIDLSNIKGRWGFEDYYFSGDILHAQYRRNGSFYIGGWNITRLLPRLNGLLVLKSKKKAAEKIIFTRGTQLRNDERFQHIVRERGITIYGNKTKEGLLDEVIILMSKEDSSNGYAYIVQMMGLLRPDDLTSYAQICAHSPKAIQVKQ